MVLVGDKTIYLELVNDGVEDWVGCAHEVDIKIA